MPVATQLGEPVQQLTEQHRTSLITTEQRHAPDPALMGFEIHLRHQGSQIRHGHRRILPPKAHPAPPILRQHVPVQILCRGYRSGLRKTPSKIIAAEGELQTMAEISSENNSTIIFPIPIEILEAFQSLSSIRPAPKAP